MLSLIYEHKRKIVHSTVSFSDKTKRNEYEKILKTNSTDLNSIGQEVKDHSKKKKQFSVSLFKGIYMKKSNI
jgi:hypothetical protein